MVTFQGQRPELRFGKCRPVAPSCPGHPNHNHLPSLLKETWQHDFLIPFSSSDPKGVLRICPDPMQEIPSPQN